MSMDRQLQANIARLRRRLPKIVDGAVRAGAGLVEDAAREEAPVLSGKMRDSLQAVRGEEGRGKVEWDVRADPHKFKDEDVFYPAIIEFGKRDTPPNPFMTRALERSKASARALILQIVKRLVS